jgi:hypothetical protein
VRFIWATADWNSWRTRAVVVAGMFVVAMLFAPIKNKLQVWADRWFTERGTRYEPVFRISRTLSQTTALRSCSTRSFDDSNMLSVGKV